MKKFFKENEDPEVGQVRTLMKAVSSGNDADGIKRLQTSLNLSKSDFFGKATLHVGQGKASIDLPSEESLLDVTMKNGRGSSENVQVSLTYLSLVLKI